VVRDLKNSLPDPPVEGDAGDSPLGEPSVQDPASRVSAFLRQVEQRASQQEEQLKAALDTVERLSEEVAFLREDRDAHMSELQRVRTEYERELKQRAERVGELTASFLQEQLASALEHMRASLEAQHEGRREQLEDAVADRERRLAETTRQLDESRQETARARTSAEQQLEAMKRRQADDNEAWAEQLAGIRAQVAAQFEERLSQLTATVTERDELFAQANKMSETLQREIERLRLQSASEIDHLRRATTEEKQQLIQELQSLKAEHKTVSDQNKSLERLIDAKDDLKRLKAFERERGELAEKFKEQEKRVTRLTTSLKLLRDVCDKSPAARSILKGSTEADLEQLFAGLD
jgi:hypothetical protein